MKFFIREIRSLPKNIHFLGISEAGLDEMFLEFNSHEEACAVMLHWRWWIGTGFSVNKNFYDFNESGPNHE